MAENRDKLACKGALLSCWSRCKGNYAKHPRISALLDRKNWFLASSFSRKYCFYKNFWKIICILKKFEYFLKICIVKKNKMVFLKEYLFYVIMKVIYPNIMSGSNEYWRLGSALVGGIKGMNFLLISEKIFNVISVWKICKYRFVPPCLCHCYESWKKEKKDCNQWNHFHLTDWQRFFYG